MCLVCVNVPRFSLGLRDVISLVVASLLAIILMVPEAEAARRKRHAGGGYSPPYASLVYDVNNGRILQETNATALRHPASVTKVMTLYMLFEQLERGRFNLDTELPVSVAASRQSPSKLGLRPGDTIAVEDAIKALVTKSANDVAVVVAEAIGGNETRFAEMMTQKARAIGMGRTVFRNASGLPNPEQVTTARDLATLGQAIQDRFPKYYGYFGTRNFAYDGDVYRNHNRLLGAVEGVDGIKTGYTRASGFNLLTSAKSDGRHIITVVLGGRSARARDVAVAQLVRAHLPVAYAGRRTTSKVVDVAAVGDDNTPNRPNAVRVAQNAPVAAPVKPPVADVKPAPQANAAPTNITPAVPAVRPRPAVIAETGREPAKAEAGENGLAKSRPPVLSANGGSTNSAASALALMNTTPRQPQLRWVQGPNGQNMQAADAGNRLVPPGTVRYTNSTTNGASVTEVDQPLPGNATGAIGKPATDVPGAITGKNEQRLSTTREVAKAEPAKAESTKPEAGKPAPPKTAEVEKPKASPARTGWVIQLAAAQSESKARGILDSAIAKNTGVLKEAEPFTEAVTKGDSTFFRARFAGFEADEAQSACKALKRTGFNCFAQKI